MKKKISKLLIPFKFLYTFCIYKYCSCKYRKVDYFEYKKLAESKFVVTYPFFSTSIYGNYKAIAQLKGKPFNFATEYLEHGLEYSSDLQRVEYLGYPNRAFIKRIYTFGDKRKQVVEKYLESKGLKRDVIAIGPYIKGAAFFKSQDELLKLREKYGKILLAFPQHYSVEYANAKSIAEDEFTKEIERISADFDKVFICIYFSDINEKLVQQYEAKGFQVVTAGNRIDPSFLSRLKDLIFLSSCAISDGTGTQIGYSVCMDRPHYFYKRKNASQWVAGKVIKKDDAFYEAERKMALQFGEYPSQITAEQIELVQEYWGKWK